MKLKAFPSLRPACIAAAAAGDSGDAARASADHHQLDGRLTATRPNPCGSKSSSISISRKSTNAWPRTTNSRFAGTRPALAKLQNPTACSKAYKRAWATLAS